MVNIIPAAEIQQHARKAAQAGHAPEACPYPHGSEHQQRWQLYFHAEQRELRAEVEA